MLYSWPEKKEVVMKVTRQATVYHKERRGQDALNVYSAQLKPQPTQQRAYGLVDLTQQREQKELTWGLPCKFLTMDMNRSFSLSLATGCHKPG